LTDVVALRCAGGRLPLYPLKYEEVLFYYEKQHERLFFGMKGAEETLEEEE